MYPPFLPNDLRVEPDGYSPFEEKRVVRRSGPEALRLLPPSSGSLFVTYVATHPPDLHQPRTGRGPQAILRFLRLMRFASPV